MCRQMRGLLQIGIILTGMTFFLVLATRATVSLAHAQKATPKTATPSIVTVQTTPTEDATVTTLNKEKLSQEVIQLQKQNEPDFFEWLQTNATLLSTLLVVSGGIFTLYRYFVERRAVQDKDLKAQAEDRFKTAVTALGDENERAQVGGAILLRSFLNTEDKKIYERYYTQIFDLAVAYLRPRRTDRTDPRKDPLRQALIVVFKEAFPLARNKLLKEQGTQFDPQSLDASRIQLDHASFRGADLKQIWIPFASLQKAVLFRADLSGARLKWADLSEVKLEEALSLKGTDLREVKGLTKERLAACKAQGAIITTPSASQSTVTSSSPQSSNAAQTSSAPSVQGISSSDPHGSRTVPSQQDLEP